MLDRSATARRAPADSDASSPSVKSSSGSLLNGAFSGMPLQGGMWRATPGPMLRSDVMHTAAATDLLSAAQNHLSREAMDNLKLWLEDPSLAEFQTDIRALVDRREWPEL